MDNQKQDNQKTVKEINTLACEILENGGGDKELLIGLIAHSNDFYRVMKTSSRNEMDSYCAAYPGFYSYVKVINDLATLISEGKYPEFLKFVEESPHPSPTPSHRQEHFSAEDLNTTARKLSTAQLQEVIAQALFKIRDLTALDPTSSDHDVIQTISLFLLSVISTAADLVEITVPGGSTLLYAEVEAGVKNGGIRSIAKRIREKADRHYSVSTIDPDDIESAMNYVGQELAMTLTKAIHELPMPLRSFETQLHAIEALIANLLSQRCTNPHEVIDSLCDHVHTALDAAGDVLGKNISCHKLH